MAAARDLLKGVSAQVCELLRSRDQQQFVSFYIAPFVLDRPATHSHLAPDETIYSLDVRTQRMKSKYFFFTSSHLCK